MRLPKRGEKGFTLIELLIVVAILGVLAAVIIPNVTRFVGSGKQEAAETELHNVQLAVTSMMLENGITTIPNSRAAADPNTLHTNDMTKFPDDTSDHTTTDPDLDGFFTDKVTDPEGYDYDIPTTDAPGYILYGHDMTGSGSTPPNPNQTDINYVVAAKTTYYYTCEADGTVKQWDVTGAVLVWD